MKTLGDIAITLVMVIFCLAVLLTATADWDNMPMHVEGFE